MSSGNWTNKTGHNWERKFTPKESAKVGIFSNISIENNIPQSVLEGLLLLEKIEKSGKVNNINQIHDK